MNPRKSAYIRAEKKTNHSFKLQILGLFFPNNKKTKNKKCHAHIHYIGT